MPSEDSSSAVSPENKAGHFATTRWSLVAAARRSEDRAAREALAKLCELYWYPLYAFVRRRTPDLHEAQDLTQAFFAHLLEKGAIEVAQAERGRFRSFLLAALRNFLANQWKREQAQRRGGGQALVSLDLTEGESRYQLEPADTLTPERRFEQEWVAALLAQVFDRLRAEAEKSGKAAQFEVLSVYLTGDDSGRSQAEAAAELGMSEAALRQAAYRLRKRYRELLREEVAHTVSDPAEIDDELGRLLDTLAN